MRRSAPFICSPAYVSKPRAPFHWPPESAFLHPFVFGVFLRAELTPSGPASPPRATASLFAQNISSFPSISLARCTSPTPPSPPRGRRVMTLSSDVCSRRQLSPRPALFHGFFSSKIDFLLPASPSPVLHRLPSPRQHLRPCFEPEGTDEPRAVHYSKKDRINPLCSDDLPRSLASGSEIDARSYVNSCATFDCLRD